jgi:hypothetical protein
MILPALILMLAMMGPVYADPLQQSENLLQNPSFEQPYVDGTADGWTTWASETEKTDDSCLDGYHYLPKWNLESTDEYVSDAVTSQYIGNNWDTWSAGVMQTVDATPGVTYRFSFVSKGRTTNDASPEPSETGINMKIRAGIDPNGSGLWDDADVVWSEPGSPHDVWQTYTVEATATGDKISVFTSADLGVPGVNQCRQYLDTWYDNAQLVTIDQPPADTPPTTEPPTDATPVPVPSAGGTICVNAFHDENANGLMDPNEGYMAGVTMVVASSTEVIGQAISDGSDTPTCFYPLVAGSYQVAQQLPGRLEMTTAGNALVAASDNHTVHVAFGSRLLQEDVQLPGDVEEGDTAPPEETPPADSADSGPDLLALSGLGVIVIGVVLLGLLLYFLLRR